MVLEMRTPTEILLFIELCQILVVKMGDKARDKARDILHCHHVDITPGTNFNDDKIKPN